METELFVREWDDGGVPSALDAPPSEESVAEEEQADS